jgi:hypothetical protein
MITVLQSFSMSWCVRKMPMFLRYIIGIKGRGLENSGYIAISPRLSAVSNEKTGHKAKGQGRIYRNQVSATNCLLLLVQSPAWAGPFCLNYISINFRYNCLFCFNAGHCFCVLFELFELSHKSLLDYDFLSLG